MSPEARSRAIKRSQCTGKQRYRDRAEANRVRRKREAAAGHSLRAYDCPFCKGFHLTKQESRH